MDRFVFRFLVPGLVLGLLLVLTPGCGGGAGNRVSVSGKVQANEKPLETGTISFVPLAGTEGPSAGGPISQGTYSIPAASGPAPGKHRVEIKATRKTGEQHKDEFSGKMLDSIQQFIPARYNSQSELSTELRPGDNRDVDFSLKLDK